MGWVLHRTLLSELLLLSYQILFQDIIFNFNFNSRYNIQDILFQYHLMARWCSPDADAIIWLEEMVEDDVTLTPAPYVHVENSNARTVTQSHIAAIGLRDF